MEAPLRFRLRGIEEGVNRHGAELTPADLDLPVVEGVEYLGPVRIDLEISRSGEQLQVRGSVEVAVRQPCVRCLQPVESEARGEISEVARKPRADEKRDGAPEGMLYHDGESLDLAEEVREVVLLEIPANPLCRPDCAGLCPRCGANLNEGPCGCGAGVNGETRWAALQALAVPPVATSPVRDQPGREQQPRMTPARKKRTARKKEV